MVEHRRPALFAREGDHVLTPSGRMAVVEKALPDGRLLLRYSRGMDGTVTLQPHLVRVAATVRS